MRFVTACFIVVAAGATALGQPVLVESDEADFSVVEIASGLEFPWSIAPIDAGIPYVAHSVTLFLPPVRSPRTCSIEDRQ